MSEYYAVVRSTDHLAHYGVKGMKWGVRKAIARGDQKKLDKHFRKAAKKLAKLQDIGLNSNKSYAKAAAYGAAAAGMGTLAVKGTSGIRDIIKNKHLARQNDLNRQLSGLTRQVYSDPASNNYLEFIKIRNNLIKEKQKSKNVVDKLDAYDKWAKEQVSFVPKKKTTYVFSKDKNGNPISQVGHTEGYDLSRGKAMRIGAGIVAAGLGAKAAQHLYRARNDAEYRERANQFKDAMDETFRGTKYEGQYVAPQKQRKKRR